MVEVNDIIDQYLFKKVKVTVTTGFLPIKGYLVDINQPVSNGVRWCFLDEDIAKQYIEDFQAKWLVPLLHEMIESLEIIEEGTEIENALILNYLP